MTETLGNARFADLTVHFGEQSLKVHKVILDSKSGWFAKLFASGFKEAEQDTIELHDDYPMTVSAMLRFCYDTLEIDDFSIDSKSGHDLLFLAELYVTADKYDVALLKAAIETQFKYVRHHPFSWLHAAGIYREIDTIYSLPRRSADKLRPEIVRGICFRIDQHMGQGAFQELLRKHAALGYELLMAEYKDHCGIEMAHWECPACDMSFYVQGSAYFCERCPECKEDSPPRQKERDRRLVLYVRGHV